MRIGVNCDFTDLPLLASEKIDFLETRFALLAGMTPDEVRSAAALCEKYGVPAETANNFFPPTVDFYGNHADAGALRDFIRRGMKNAAALGCKVAVVGSGAARKVPEGLPKNIATEKFASVMRLCADIGFEYGIAVAVEPLNFNETNLINTVAEAADFCRAEESSGIFCIADFFHMFMNGEPVDSISAAKKYLVHAHIARPSKDRFAPRDEDIPACEEWAEKLRSVGYKGRLTLECCREKDLACELEVSRRALDVFRAV